MRPSNILSGDRPIPGTVLPEEKAACSICAKKFSGLRLSATVSDNARGGAAAERGASTDEPGSSGPP
jgi:hypothetical protein